MKELKKIILGFSVIGALALVGYFVVFLLPPYVLLTIMFLVVAWIFGDIILG